MEPANPNRIAAKNQGKLIPWLHVYGIIPCVSGKLQIKAANYSPRICIPIH
jgi:hypothetical protein